jgi:hypothetical protein
MQESSSSAGFFFGYRILLGTSQSATRKDVTTVDRFSLWFASVVLAPTYAAIWTSAPCDFGTSMIA